MLSPQELELLTAHVDGELTEQQRHQVVHLLRRSGEARDLLQKLEADAHALRRMPRLGVPQDLTASVLERLQQGRGPLVRPRVLPAPRGRGVPAWVGYAAAAAVLLGVLSASFFLNLPTPKPVDPSGGLVQNHAHQDKEKNNPDRQDQVIVKVGPEQEHPFEKMGPELPGTISKPSTDKQPVVSPSFPDDPSKHKPKKPDSIFASGGNDRVKFERVEMFLPTPFKLHELDKPANAKLLLEQLSRSPSQAVKIELIAKDGCRAFDRLHEVLRSKKIRLFLDPTTRARLKKPLWKTDYALFTENLRPEDVVDILRATGIADRQLEDKKVSEMRYDGAGVLRELSAADRRELTDLLGIDPTRVRPRRTTTGAVPDIHKPFPEETVSHLVAALEGKGPQRPGQIPPIHVYATHLANGRNRPAELKQYLDARVPPVAGTIQVFLVIRHLGG